MFSDGSIVCDGQAPPNGLLASPSGGAGGSAGGAIQLRVGQLAGRGNITSNGGWGGVYRSPAYYGGGGAGGRIAVYYGSSTYSGSIQAYGGQTIIPMNVFCPGGPGMKRGNERYLGQIP